jgi:hypothetical protein
LSSQGSNADFELSLLNFNDIFEVQPTLGSKSVIAGLVVKDGSKLDYEAGPRVYSIRVRARSLFEVSVETSFTHLGSGERDKNDGKKKQ